MGKNELGTDAEWAMVRLTRWTIGLSIITATLAIAATVFSGWQAWISRASLEVARGASEHQLRAYVQIKNVAFSPASVTGEPRLIITASNGGVTPATDTKIEIKSVIIFEQSPRSVMDTSEVIGTNVFAGDDLEFETAVDLSRVKSRDALKLIISGVFVYNDVFRIERRAWFVAMSERFDPTKRMDLRVGNFGSPPEIAGQTGRPNS